MTIAVLGAGMVGSTIAVDLSLRHRVTSIDQRADPLKKLHARNPAIQIQPADLRQADLSALLAPYDLVITAVPGFMGYQLLKQVIEAGKNVVDISFFPEDALELHELAIQKQVTVITDCGVAPGMSNLIVGHYDALMEISSFACYVGGLPVHPQPPFYYKAPFSPVDVIQEYLRPARLVEEGLLVTKPALSDREFLDFAEVGRLEAFNTDGLRSLVHTMSHIPDMKEKTLRYPGHIDLIIALQQAGFFNTTPVMAAGLQVIPLDLTSTLLVDQWKLQPGEPEFTVMKVILDGPEKTITYSLLDYYDPVTGFSSMARTTGFTCTAAAELLMQGLFTEKGVFPPEKLGCRPDCFQFILHYLAQRNVQWKKTTERK
ncbi:MAG: saccharopine dehydrogenase C-terminal domain-containing protein [Chitinophagaceae bacterium]